MSQTSDLIKSSFYDLEYDGTKIETVTDVDLPTMEYEPVQHKNGKPYPKKEAQGIPKYGDLVVERDMIEGQSTVLYEAFKKAQNTPDTGSIKVPVNVLVKNVKGKTIWRVECTGCWVCAYDPPDMTSTGSDTLSEKFTISCDHVKQKA